jgi:hypothetical protein
MKKTMTSLIALAMTMTVLQLRADTLTLAVSTDGPDLYADDTPVLVGESYLVVYVKSGAIFSGVQSDGALVNPVDNIAVLTLQAIAGSRCPYTPISYSSADYDANGTWMLVLLDTRKADGSVGGLVAGYSATDISPAKKASSTSLNSLSGKSGVVAGEISLLPPGVVAGNKPVIASMEQGAASVKLGIAEFSQNVNYEVQTTTDLASGNWVPAKAGVASRLAAVPANIQNGLLKEEIPVAEGEGSRFFRVVVPTK